MQILFLHDNFPAQFGPLALYLADEGWDVWFGTQRAGSRLLGIKTFNYRPHRQPSDKVHPYTAGYERAVLNGQAVARAGLSLKSKGLSPHIVVAHSGWGPGLFVKDVWPNAKYVSYFEWYYSSNAPDVTYLDEAGISFDEKLRARARNAAIWSDLISCDAGLCPTQFQRSQFPKRFQDKIAVIHDGIDTEYFSPLSGARLNLQDCQLPDDAPLVTYVARGMEPYRGFPELMQALSIVLQNNKDVHAVIVGEDRIAYGKKLPEGDSYKKRALSEHELDLSRLHFTGLLPRAAYRSVLQASTVHVYFTVPFVLSWSLMEAMSTGCSIIASDVDPVKEVIEHDYSGVLVNHRDVQASADAILRMLDDADEPKDFSHCARDTISRNYSFKEQAQRRRVFLEHILDS